MEAFRRHFLAALTFFVVWAYAEGGLLAATGAAPALAAWANLGVLAPLIALAAPLLALLAVAWRAMPRPALDSLDAQRRAIVAVLLAPPLLALPALVVIWLGETLLSTIKTPAFAVAALLLLWVLLAAVTLLLAPLFYLPLDRLIGRVQRGPFGRFVSVGRLVVLLGGVGLVLGAGACIVLRETLSAVPWWTVAAPLLATVPALLAYRVRRHTTAACAVLAVVAVATALLAYRPPRKLVAHRVIWAGQTSLAGLWGEYVERLTDRDDDGASSWLGGGDCAPDDPAIGPTAREIANNQIDEDCDGHDLEAATARLPRGSSTYPVPANAPKRPHIILITSDALSWRHTSPGGYERDLTPNLERLTRDATTFHNAFSASSSTRLSMPAILVGKFNSLIEMTDKRSHPYGWADSTLTLAERLAQKGYDTVQVLGDRYFTSANWPGYQQGFGQIVTSPIEHPKDKGHTAPEVTDAAIEVVEGERTKPLFLWVHYFDAHGPYDSPFPDSKARTPLERYDDEVRFADQHWGRLFEAVAKRWSPEEYILIFTADHGETFGGPPQHHGLDVQSAVLDIPFIVQTAQQRGTTREGLVTQLDIAPTIANLVGSPPDPEWLGESLLPTLFEGSEPKKQIIFSLHYIPEDAKRNNPTFWMIGARTADWYFVEDLRRRTHEVFRWAPEKRDVLASGAEADRARQDLRYTTLETLDWLREHERSLRPPKGRTAKH